MQYLDLLYRYQEAISIEKYDLGLAKNYKHKINLKNEDPVYRKQFKIPEAHHNFIEQTLEEWLKLGVVRRLDLLYNSPICCVPKKKGQGLRIIQDFRELNQNSHSDKYSLKEITECISNIGRANSNIFSTLDLTSGFWQQKLDEKSQPLTAFTIPGKGQFYWVTSPMGLLGYPVSFQRLMEGVLRNLQNIIVYIDDLLIHSDTHEWHLQTLKQVLQRLQQNHLMINLEKCIFGKKEVSYLRFTLMPEGIKPGKNKLKAIETAKIRQTSRRSDLSWAFATSSGPTSRTSQLSLLPCLSSPGRTPDTKEDRYQMMPWQPSLPSRNNSFWNRSWLFHGWTANMP
jgi:hypothetical protein